MTLEKRYQPQKIEKEIYSFWEKGKFFLPQKTKKRWSCLMPPPNANGPLHLGHAVFITIQDVLTRFWRMRGYETLWLPGYDHAGFETQVVFEKELEKKGKSRFEMPPQEFFKECLEFVKKNIKETKKGLKILGASCDFSKERFTMQKEVVKIFYESFEKLFKKGLIYRKERIVNWCPKHQTSLSDLETISEEREDFLYYIKYPLDNKKEEIIIATVRPETIFADVAVAVNPKDERYKKFFGKKAVLPLVGRLLPVIKDKEVKMDFGSGALKITPFHDPLDFEIGKRHNLPLIEVIDKEGKLKLDEIIKEARKNKGEVEFLKKINHLSSDVSRKKVVEFLEKKGFLFKKEKINHTVSLCYKCKTKIEPRPQKTWFLKMKDLAKKTEKVIKKNELKFFPSRFKKISLHWLKEIRDWNISRQISWGIEMPVYFCQEKLSKKCQKNEGIIVSSKKIKKCPFCGSKKIKKEKEVFDTWFSSCQWPFATLKSFSKKLYQKFYPYNLLETGYDILFFWVLRMVIMSLAIEKKIPFWHVVLHGIVRDKKHQKMSKSKGNVISPFLMIEKYGADALRMSLVFDQEMGSDIIFFEEKVVAQRNFTQKIWSAARFVLMNLPENFSLKKIKPSLIKEDRWILKELKKTEKKVTRFLENYKIHLAAKEIYHFFWKKFCDKTIENCKKRIYGKKNKKDFSAEWILSVVLLRSLKLLHPFVPFITEKIYQVLPFKEKRALIIEKWEV